MSRARHASNRQRDGRAVVAALLMLAWCCAALRFVRAAEPSAPGAPLVVGAPAWILMDAETGRVLAERNARKRMFPASTTKTMTALVAIESGKLDDIVRIGPNPPKTGERSSLLMQGEKFVLRDLLRAALIRSSNDACVAIAEAVAGSVPAFARMMNAKAQEIGARDTHFVNPHGLHAPQHYTTARDLALIARAAMRHAFFNRTVRTREAVIHGNYKIGAQRLLFNTNRLLRHWPECDGVKTGYTKQAGRCLIASATRQVNFSAGVTQPFRLLCVVLHSPDTWSDARLLLQHQGFERFAPVEVTRAGEEFGVVNVAGGAFSAKAVTPRAVQMPLRRDERETLSQRVHLLPLKAPIKSGQAIGRIEFVARGHTLVEVPLLAREAVPASIVARVLPPVARVMPSNPSLRWGIYGGACLALALLLSGLKIRATTSGTRHARRRPRRPLDQTSGENPDEDSSEYHGRPQAISQARRQVTRSDDTRAESTHNIPAHGTATSGAITLDAATPTPSAHHTAAPGIEPRSRPRRNRPPEESLSSGPPGYGPPGYEPPSAKSLGDGEHDAPDAASRQRRAAARRAQTEAVRARLEAWQAEHEQRERQHAQRQREQHQREQRQHAQRRQPHNPEHQ